MNIDSKKPFFYTITEDIARKLKEYLSIYVDESGLVLSDKNVCKFLQVNSNVSMPDITYFINNVIYLNNKEDVLHSLFFINYDNIKNGIFDIISSKNNISYTYTMIHYRDYVEDLKLKINNYVSPEKGYLSATDLLQMDAKYLSQDALNAVYDSKLFTAIVEFCNLTGLHDYRLDIAVDSNLQKQMEEKLNSKI